MLRLAPKIVISVKDKINRMVIKMFKYTKCAKCGKDLPIPVTSENPNWKLYCPDCGQQETSKQLSKIYQPKRLKNET
jgi:predicted RNA-binding Zn-ribbon protein involved in translation (DUF1610 family)